MEDDKLFIRIREYRSLIWARKWWILGVGVLLATFLGYRAWRQPTNFIATAKFHPETESSSSVNLENPVSLLFGGGFVPEESQNMIGILKSRRIAEAVASDTIVTYADTFFVYKKELPYGLYFNGSKHDTISLEGRELLDLPEVLEDMFQRKPSVLGRLVMLITGKPEPRTRQGKIYFAGQQLLARMSAKVGEEGFINFELIIPDQDLAKILSDKYIQALSTYYQNQKTEKAKRNLDFFTARADSVKDELDMVHQRIASYLDNSRYSIRATQQVLPRELEATSEILQQMYVNLMVSREQAVSQLLENTPILQVLDFPRGPFEKEKGSIAKGILIGLVIAILVLSIWFTRKLLFQDVKVLIVRALSPAPNEDL